MSGDNGPSKGSRRAYLGSQLAADLIGPTVIGVVLDWQFGWKPWGTLAGLGLGLMALTYHLILLARELGRDEPPGPDRSSD